MYTRVRKVLGVSLIALAIVLANIPANDASAALADAGDDKNEDVCTVTFSLNGGTYTGEYNGYNFKNQTPVIVLDNGERISEFPEEKNIKYSGYQTEKDVWFTDKGCTQPFDTNSRITKSMTLYKKWYDITADGDEKASKGFYLNPDKTVLYKYDGDNIYVELPKEVKLIAKDAFSNLEGIRGIKLSPEIEEVQTGAFSFGADDERIIFVYDADTLKSRKIGNEIDDDYEQLVHSEYLDAEMVEEIAGIDYKLADAEKAENKTEIKTYSAPLVKSVVKAASVETAETKTDNKEAINETKAVTLAETKTDNKESIKENKAVTPSESKTDNKETVKETKAVTPSEPKTDNKETVKENKAVTPSESKTDNKEAVKGTKAVTVSEAKADNKEAVKETKVVTVSEAKTDNKEAIKETKTVTAATATAPKSTMHVKDITPKTGDSMQYRMILVCILFLSGLLLVITGNRKVKRRAAF